MIDRNTVIGPGYITVRRPVYLLVVDREGSATRLSEHDTEAEAREEAARQWPVYHYMVYMVDQTGRAVVVETGDATDIPLDMLTGV